MAAGLARWLLGRDRGIRTSGIGGFVVPAGLFVAVPPEFLEGARIDGTMFRPALAGFEPHGLGYRPAEAQPADVVPVDDGPQPEPVSVGESSATKRAPGRPRKRPTGRGGGQ
jgi:hypothetical protein